MGVLALVLAGTALAQETDARGTPAATLCAAMPAARVAARDFAEMFANGSDDLNDDGLPDSAALALLEEAACNPNAPAALAVSSGTAYAANLAFFDAEVGAAALAPFREGIAALMLTSATTEGAVKLVLGLAVPPIALAADYTQVTCTAGACLPLPTVRTSATGEFLDSALIPRAADEPYAGDGDLDGDTVTNVTEFNNIEAQGGELDDFVVVATSPELDGTEPVRSNGDSGCFIATAAYGTPLAEQIGELRRWRDASLLRHAPGTAFTDAYYRLSPSIASRVAASEPLAGAVRALLVPVIALIRADAAAAIGVMIAAVSLAAVVAGRRRFATCPIRRPRKGRGR
jgi:hypothetical protein